jgi:hypothetical protein
MMKLSLPHKNATMKDSILLIVFCCISVNIIAQSKGREYTQAEKRAINVISALPEVKTLIGAYADSLPHIEVAVTEDPIEGQDYYVVKVGQRFREDGGNYFLSFYGFCVTPKTYEIRNLDVRTLTPISLKKWRARLAKEKAETITK